MRFSALAAAAFAACFAAGCGSNDDVIDPAVAIRAGWDAFSAGNYAQAETQFLAASSLDPSRVEAHVGAGWSRAFQGNLDGAAASYLDALALSRRDADALGGLAAVRLAQGDLEDAAARARAALDRSPNWVFAHRAGVNALDLHLVIAQASALQGDSGYALAQSELNLLDGSNGLDPASPASWEVDGVSFGSYGEALVAALEKVERSVGSTSP